MAGDNKLFEWYKILVDIGKFEVEHSRTRFFDTAKIHLAILAGVLALSSYALANDKDIVLIPAIIACIFGIVYAIAWLTQIAESSKWTRRWYLKAAEIEETAEFKSTVSSNNIKVFSDPDIEEDLRNMNIGASSKLQTIFTYCLIGFYIIIVVGIISPISYWYWFIIILITLFKYLI